MLCALATSASATATIVRGVGIGKVKVGMTRTQVEKILGKDALLNEPTTVGSTTYFEYGWNFGTWSVGFLQRGSRYHVAQVATSLRGEKTTAGIGVGSAFKADARAYPQAICTGYYKRLNACVVM